MVGRYTYTYYMVWKPPFTSLRGAQPCNIPQQTWRTNGSVTRCPHSDLPAGKGEGLRAAGTGNDMELHWCTYTCTVYRDDDNQLLTGNSDKKPANVVRLYLVGGFKHFYFPFHIWDVILPIDELIFFKMAF